jgi:hypothetical protein
MRTVLKTTVALLILGMGLVHYNIASAQPQNKESLTPEYIEIVHTMLGVSQFDQNIEMMLKQISLSNRSILSRMYAAEMGKEIDPKTLEIYEDKFQNYMKDGYFPHMKDEMAPKIYAQYMSLDEMRVIDEFYKTDAGKKVALHSNAITQQIIQKTEAHVRAATQEILGSVIESAKKANQE